LRPWARNEALAHLIRSPVFVGSFFFVVASITVDKL
jgi:hypothetical protein